MAEKKPLALYSGDIKEIQAGDTVYGAAANNTPWEGSNWTDETKGESESKIQDALKEVGITYENRTSQLVEEDNHKIIEAICEPQRMFNETSLDTNVLPNITAYWEAEDLTDSIKDNNLTNNGTTFSAGKHNNAFTFDGSSNSLSIVSNDDFRPASKFSMSIWVKITNVDSHRAIMDKLGSIGLAYYNNSNKFYFRIYQSDDTAVHIGGIDFSLDEYHHIVVFADGSNIKMYVDNILKGTSTYDGTLKQNTEAFYIGATATADYMLGQIDELCFIKDYALTESDINLLYNNGNGSFLEDVSVKKFVVSDKKTLDVHPPYDDSDVLKDADTLSTVTPTNKLITESESTLYSIEYGEDLTAGDAFRVAYDNGVPKAMKGVDTTFNTGDKSQISYSQDGGQAPGMSIIPLQNGMITMLYGTHPHANNSNQVWSLDFNNYTFNTVRTNNLAEKDFVYIPGIDRYAITQLTDRNIIKLYSCDSNGVFAETATIDADSDGKKYFRGGGLTSNSSDTIYVLGLDDATKCATIYEYNVTENSITYQDSHISSVRYDGEITDTYNSDIKYDAATNKVIILGDLTADTRQHRPSILLYDITNDSFSTVLKFSDFYYNDGYWDVIDGKTRIEQLNGTKYTVSYIASADPYVTKLCIIDASDTNPVEYSTTDFPNGYSWICLSAISSSQICITTGDTDDNIYTHIYEYDGTNINLISQNNFIDNLSLDQRAVDTLYIQSENKIVLGAAYSQVATLFMYDVPISIDKRNTILGVVESTGIAGNIHTVKLPGAVLKDVVTGTIYNTMYVQLDSSLSTEVTDYPIGNFISNNELAVIGISEMRAIQHTDSDGSSHSQVTANTTTLTEKVNISDVKSPITANNKVVTEADIPAGGLTYLGTWDADTNSPSLSDGSGSNGDYYKVSVAGTTAIDGISEWAVGDWIISNATEWQKIDNTETVSSVAGKIGAVTLVKADVGLGNVDNTSDADKPVSTAQQNEIDTKEDAFTKNSAFNKAFGTGADKVCEGDDSRLSDARTPISHTHIESEIIDLDHDAQKIKGKVVDDTDIADNTIMVYDGTADKIIYVALPAGGDSFSVNRETLSGDKTLTESDATYQILDENNGNRKVYLPESPSKDLQFVIGNDGNHSSTYYIDVLVASDTSYANRLHSGKILICMYDKDTDIWSFDAGGSVYRRTDSNAYDGNRYSVANGYAASGYYRGVANGYNAIGYTYGVANGYNAKGYNYGVANGYNASGYNYGVANGVMTNGYDFGLANGYAANGYDHGVSNGYNSKGYSEGVANGYSADGHNFGVANGYRANATKQYGSATGVYSKQERLGGHAITGDHQSVSKFHREEVTWHGLTTDDTQTEIFLHKVTSSRCEILTDSVVTFDMIVTALDTTNDEYFSQQIIGVIANNADTTALKGTITYVDICNTTGGTPVVNIEADDTNDALIVKVTGLASTDITWGVDARLIDVRK